MKTFLKYTLWVILLMLFSELLINLGFEADYQKIKGKNQVSNVIINQAEATRVNGRMKGTIRNLPENPIQKKYLKIDFYSPRNILLGTHYIEISELKEGETKDFELHFKQKEVESYVITQVDEKIDIGTSFELIPQDLTRQQVLLGTVIAMLIFW